MRIEPTDAAALRAVILRDLEAIERIEEHAASLMGAAASMSRAQVDSLGFALHNLYNALENSFTQISLSFENHVKDRVRWHRELLDKMFLAIPPVRPAVLPEAVRPLLADLLAFRHLFRHGYDLSLDQEKVVALFTRWDKDGRGQARQALDAFCALLADAAGVSPE